MEAPKIQGHLHPFHTSITEPPTKTKAPSTPSSEQQAECQVCGETVAKLSKHMRKLHPGISVNGAGQTLFNCEECDTNFDTDEDLDAHRLIYHS